MVSVAGEQVVRLALNRGKQDGMVFFGETNTTRQCQILRRTRYDQFGYQLLQAAERRPPIESQISARLGNRVLRRQQRRIFELPKALQAGI